MAENVFYILIGMLLGFLIFLIIFFIIYKKDSGKISIDSSDPNKDSYCFFINDLDSLSKKKFIILKIINSREIYK